MVSLAEKGECVENEWHFIHKRLETMIAYFGELANAHFRSY